MASSATPNSSSSSWSFENAIDILEQKDLQLTPTLKAYLAVNEPLLVSPFKNFISNNSTSKLLQAELDQGSISIGGASYSVDKSYSIRAEHVQYLAEKLSVDAKQALRVILHANEKKLWDLVDLDSENVEITGLSFSTDDKEKDSNNKSGENGGSLYTSKNLFYALQIAREKRQLIGLIVSLFKNQSLDPSLGELVDKILVNNEAIITDLIDSLLVCIESIFANETGNNSDNNNNKNDARATSEQAEQLTDEEAFNISLSKLVKQESILLVISYLKLLIQLSIPVNVSKPLVNKWFDLMNNTDFLNIISDVSVSDLPDSFNFEHYLRNISSLQTISSLLFLGWQVQGNFFDFSAEYLEDPETYKFVQDTIANSISANPIIIFSWASVVYFKISLFEQIPEKADPFLGKLQITLNDLRITVEEFGYRARNAQRGISSSLLEIHNTLSFDDVHQVIILSFTKFAVATIHLNYKSSLVISQIFEKIPAGHEDNIEKLMSDEFVLLKLQEAKLKSPEELDSLNTLLNFLSIDGRVAISVLNSLNTYLHFFETGQLDYEYTTDNIADGDANSNQQIAENNQVSTLDQKLSEFVVLTKDLIIRPILEPFESSSRLCFEAGTKGKLLTNPGSKVSAIVFKYSYSGWSLFGKTFENVVHNLFHEQKANSALAPITGSTELVHEASSNSKHEESENADNASYDDDTKKQKALLTSIINVLIAAFSRATEEESKQLIKDFEQTTSLSFFELVSRLLNYALVNTDLPKLTLINQLLYVLLVKGYSTEAWAILIRSGYFEINGSDNSLLLYSIISTERTRKNFDFSLSLTKLTDALIVDSLSIASSSSENNISLKIKDEVITRLISLFINCFEGFVYWSFSKPSQKFELGVAILGLFSKIIFTIYSIDLNKETKPNSINNAFNDPISVLKNSGAKIINSFLTTNSFDTSAIKPFLTVIDSLVYNPLAADMDDNVKFWLENFVNATLDFTKLIVSLRSMLELSVSLLETELFKDLKNLIRVYLNFRHLKLKIVSLVTVLINGNFIGENPPSVLAHLGNKGSKILLNSIVIDLEGSLVDFNLKNALYDFFSSVMEKNQEGLSVLLLTGCDIHEKNNKITINKTKKADKSVLQLVKRSIINLESVPESVAIHLLDAISFAFNSWAAAQKIDNDDEKFIQSLTNYFDKHCDFDKDFVSNELEDLSDTVRRTVNSCYRVKLISSIGEILALYLFSCPNEKIIKPILRLLESKNFIDKHASQIFRIHNYESSLHSETHKDFHSYFPKFKLEDFHRTPLNRFRRFGVGTVYNLSLMDQLFGLNYEWNDFLRHNVIQTSLNLQYVSAQTNLIKSWGALISSYVRYKSANPTKDYIDLASLLLSINNEEGIPAPSFREIYLERIELAFWLVYNLPSSKAPVDAISDAQVIKLFESVVTSLLSEEVNFLVSLSNDDVYLYRSLLRILFISLNLCSNKAYLLEKNPSLIIDLFNKVIANGTKIIIATVQNELSQSSSARQIEDLAFSNGAPKSAISQNDKSVTVKGTKDKEGSDAEKSMVSPSMINKIEDLTLVISIFKSFVSINFSSKINETFSIILDVTETMKFIMELYAYSDSMLIDGEPIFADLALVYITELISIDAVTEKLLNYGLFSTLINSPISMKIQKGKIRSDLQPRYHHIWSNGLLTIVLVLLSKFGPRVISDICMFLIQFEKQISFTLKSWSADSLIITTPMIHETSQLVLLQRALNTLNFREYVGINLDKEFSSSLLLFPGLDTAKQRRKLNDSFNHLLTHPKYLQSRIVITSAEDQAAYGDESKGKTKLANRLIGEIRELSESLTAL